MSDKLSIILRSPTIPKAETEIREVKSVGHLVSRPSPLFHLHSGYGKFGNIRENMVMSKQHFKPFPLYKQTAFDDFVRGLSAQPVQKADRFFTREV